VRPCSYGYTYAAAQTPGIYCAPDGLGSLFGTRAFFISACAWKVARPPPIKQAADGLHRFVPAAAVCTRPLLSHAGCCVGHAADRDQTYAMCNRTYAMQRVC
jgi:hypothetical protein